MLVVKRDGTKQEFNREKIFNAVKKCGCKDADKVSTIAVETVEYLLNKKFDGEVPVEAIQDTVESVLMESDQLDPLKKFILYRNERAVLRDAVQRKIDFIENYKKSSNTANATIDDNANVANKNVAVMNSELHKEDNAEINLRMWEKKLHELYPDFDYKSLRKDADSVLYLHDLSSQVGMPYCVAITMYPFLLNGIKELGGLSAKPKNLDSFCGMFINMVFAMSSQYKGAVATPGLLLCMDWFIRKEYGSEYTLKLDSPVTGEGNKRTLRQQIHQYFQQICYSLMQPAGGRGNQAVFWNVSIFDKPFFDTMYGEFFFPDGTMPSWCTFNWLQKEFVSWLNEERLKCMLTFPVVSACLIYQKGKFLDEDMHDFVCTQYANGNSFFTYISDSADSLSSCCRLSSKLSKPQFSFTNGQLSEMTGSKNVITLNISRIIQDWRKAGGDMKDYIVSVLDRVYKYQTAYNSILMDLFEAGMLPAYNAGFIDMKKQYLTIGINGLNQAAEFLGMTCRADDEKYKEFCNTVFSTIKEQNALHKTKELMFNTELTPCESAAIKLYNRDKRDGYWVPEDTNLYASYIYKPNEDISPLERLRMHGSEFCGDYLDGGSSAHINLDAHLSKEQYEKVIKYAAEAGCKYFTFNVPNSECDDCGYITKVPITECPKCKSQKINYYDRIIGYLTKLSCWSKGRQEEHKTRVFNNLKE